jgi:antagonist of KipI
MSKTLRVISPGMLTTLQDLGRYGYAHLGVSASGAADRVSARISNRLLGNSDNTPVLEMTLVGGDFEFGCDSFIALAGADFAATIDEVPVPLHEAVRAKAGAILRCGPARAGARGYLAVAGGFLVTPVLGSASTHVMSGIGGLSGRALKRGDTLPLQKVGGALPPRKLNRPLSHELRPRSDVRVTLGPQHGMFGEDRVMKLCSQPYRVSDDSNRVGLRLQGQTIEPIMEPKMLTEGAALGAIQVPPGGQPIILFVEHQTTGGYPKIANVISADLPSVGQLRPRDEVRFELVTIEQALQALEEQELILKQTVPPA